MSTKTIFSCNGCTNTIEQTALRDASWFRLSVRDTKAGPLAIRSAEDTSASTISRDEHACSVGCLSLCVERFAGALAKATPEDVVGFKLDVMSQK